VLEALFRFVVALWHVAGIVLLIVLFTEFGIDGWRWASRRLRYGRGRLPDRSAAADAYAGADWATGYFDEFARSVHVDWKPYVEWWQRPFRGAYVTIDERGLRPTPGEGEGVDDRVGGGRVPRILCFGGSTMMGMGARDAATIPAVLARRLAELGHPAAITNLGQLGHNSTQEVISLHQLLKAGGRADIVLFYDGINEMICAEQTGEADRLFNDSGRMAEFNLLHPSRRGDLVCAALVASMPRSLRRLRQLTGLPLRGPMPPPMADLTQIDVAGLARQVIDVYAANVRLARLLAREHGFATLFFWQPVITTKTVKSGDEQRFEADYSRDVAGRRRLFEAIIAERRRRPEFASAADTIDLSAIFDARSDPVYIDAYHLSESGNIAVAEAMLPALVEIVAAWRGSA
jgi:lysophospholipase L1-like esterase